jgi:hypothetical protein
VWKFKAEAHWPQVFDSTIFMQVQVIASLPTNFLPSVCQRIASLNSLLAPLCLASIFITSSSLFIFFQKSMKSG